MKTKRFASQRAQRGMGMWGNMVFFGLIGLFVIIGIKVMPLYLNEFKVDKVLHSVAKDSVFSGDFTDLTEVHRTLEKRWDIEDINTLEYKDVKIVGNEQKKSFSYDYEARVKLFYNISVVVHFSDTIPISGRST